MSDEKLYTSRLSRALKVGGIAARAGFGQLSYLGSRSFSPDLEASRKKHESDIGRILFNGLSQLRGTALKASQILSHEMDFLPEGIRKELEKSCYKVPPINRASVRKIFLNEFGMPPQHLYESFETTAFAAASLGQVHRGYLKSGPKVAVKIQYPGVQESIDSDLKILSFVFASLRRTTNLLPKSDVMELVMDEVRLRLKEEVNYLKEAEHARWFSENLNVPGLVIPSVITDLTTEKVITLEYLEGLHVDDWLLTEPSQGEKSRVGQIIFDAFLHSVFKNGVVHADPHIGNYLCLKDGNVALLDFGCVKRLETGFSEKISRLYFALTTDDVGLIISAYQDLNILSQEITEAEYRSFVEPLLIEMQQWITEPLKQMSYDFSKLPTPKKANIEDHKLAIPYLNSLDKDQLYFDRTLFGTFQLLKKLGARVDTSGFWQLQNIPA